MSWRRIATVLAALALLGGAAALVAADLLGHWWWGELFQHPRPQIAVGLLLAAGLMLCLHRQRWAWWLLLLPLWASIGVLWEARPVPRIPATPTDCTVLSANLLSDNPDPAGAVAKLLAVDADVLVLLEATPAWKPHLLSVRERYAVRKEILRDDNFGICVYARRGVVRAWWVEDVEVPGLHLAMDGLDILALHPPPPFSEEYHRMWTAELDAAAAWAASRPRAIVLGDLNATPWSAAHRRLRLIGGLHGPGGLDTLSPTWLRGTPLASTIDHVLIGPGLGFVSWQVGEEIGSDHRPVLARIGIASGSSRFPP